MSQRFAEEGAPSCRQAGVALAAMALVACGASTPPISLRERFAREATIELYQGRITQGPDRIVVEVYPIDWTGVASFCFLACVLLYLGAALLFPPGPRNGAMLLGLPLVALGLWSFWTGLSSGLTHRDFIARTNEGQIEMRIRMWGFADESKKTPRKPEACSATYSRSKNQTGYRVRLKFEHDEQFVLNLARQQDAEALCWILTSAAPVGHAASVSPAASSSR